MVRVYMLEVKRRFAYGEISDRIVCLCKVYEIT